MKNSIIFVMALLLTLSFASIDAVAQWGRFVKGNGIIKTQERTLGDFSEITLSCSVDLYLRQGNENKAVVKADENLLDMIETEISGNTLTIDIEGNISRSREMVVYITLKDLNKLMVNGSGNVKTESKIAGMDMEILINGSGDVEMDLDMKNVNAAINGSGEMDLSGVSGDFSLKISGSGDFEGDNMRLNLCDIQVYGSGDVEMAGRAATIKIKQSASGDINLFNLDAQDARVNSNGSGNVVLSVSGKLEADLHGSGDITYKGEPLSIDVSATGSGEVYHR